MTWKYIWSYSKLQCFAVCSCCPFVIRAKTMKMKRRNCYRITNLFCNCKINWGRKILKLTKWSSERKLWQTKFEIYSPYQTKCVSRIHCWNRRAGNLKFLKVVIDFRKKIELIHFMIILTYFLKNNLIWTIYLLVKELANVSISLIYKENEKMEIEKQLDDMEQQLISVGTLAGYS